MQGEKEKQAPIVEAFDAWREYERRKAAWTAEHPDSTPRQYEQAMREIANECGV